MAQLARNVHIGGVWYRPGDTVPDEVAARLTNPAVWAGGQRPVVAAPAADPDAGGSAPPPTEKSETQAPPRSGRGSGEKAWAQFAHARGVQVPEGAGRDDIIAACEQAGVVDPE